jgi:type I restriction enzyme S subunit
LSEACQEIYRYPTYYGITYVPSGVPEIRGELLVGDGSIETDASKFRYISSETAAKFPRTALLEGDIVMSVRGTIGKLGLVPRTLQGANITANLLRISPNRSLVRPRYLFAFLSSSAGVRQISSITTSTTISTFRASDFQKLMLPIPPLPEQDRFVSLATEFVATLEAIGFAGKAIDAAWNVLREHAFSGRLTSNWRVEHMTELRAEMKEQARLLKLPMPTEMDSSL